MSQIRGVFTSDKDELWKIPGGDARKYPNGLTGNSSGQHLRGTNAD